MHYALRHAPVFHRLASAKEASLAEELYEYAKKNLLWLNVYVKDSFATRIVRDEKMTRTSFVANVGGLLGLCMGFSLVSVVEVMAATMISHHCLHRFPSFFLLQIVYYVVKRQTLDACKKGRKLRKKRRQEHEREVQQRLQERLEEEEGEDGQQQGVQGQ